MRFCLFFAAGVPPPAPPLPAGELEGPFSFFDEEERAALGDDFLLDGDISSEGGAGGAGRGGGGPLRGCCLRT